MVLIVLFSIIELHLILIKHFHDQCLKQAIRSFTKLKNFQICSEEYSLIYCV